MPDKERITALAKRISESGNADMVKRVLCERKNRFDDGGDTDEEYFDTLNAASVSSRLPSIDTARGRRIAKKMAEHVASGQMSMTEVPDRYKTYVEGEVKGAIPVRKGINKAGESIYNAVDTLTAFMPGPVGTVNWLGHMGADVVSGNWGKLGMDVGMAALMGGAGKLAGKYIPQLVSKSPNASAFMKKVGNFVDDMTWDASRRDAARAAWSENLDARQRFGVVDDADISGNGIGVVLGWGDETDAIKGVNRDTISAKLLDDWLFVNNHEAYNNMVRARRASWSKDILAQLDVPDGIPDDLMARMLAGDFDWGNPVEMSKLGAGWGSKSHTMADDIKLNSMMSRSITPHNGNIHLPLSVNIAPLTGKFVEPLKARDIAFDLLRGAAAEGKLTPETKSFYTVGAGGQPEFVKSEVLPINPESLKKPFLHFTGKGLLDSYQGNGHIALGMSDQLKGLGISSDPYGLGMQFFSPIDVVGHEVGHIHPGFNTQTGKKSVSSPHYGMDYSAVPSEKVVRLMPDVPSGVKVNAHDMELNETISDALGFRTLLSMKGINDGSTPYTKNDIYLLGNEYIRKEGFIPTFRFQQLHPDVEDQVWLLNNGWKYGGPLLRRFDGGTPGQLYYNTDFATVDNTTPVNYVTESGPFLQLDADSLYGGEITPAVMVADDQSKKTVSRAQHNANRRRVEEMMRDDAPLLVSPRDVTAVKQQTVAEPQVAVDKSSVESIVMDAMVHQNYGRLKKLNKAENKESIKALQRELLAHGYDLGKSGENKDGVDGVIGSKTLRALRAYRNEKPKVEYGNVEDPLPISNAVYAVASNIPGLKYFVPDSFRGTEDEARNLGYKTYIDPVDGKRKSVNYPVTLDGNDAPTRRDIAAAQMRKYGITGDFTSDKSAYQRNNYAYLPAYGYNFLAPFYNKKENLPVADPFTGRAVRLGANRVETGAERAKDWYNKTFGKNVVYTYADASPAREDYRNLYFGYPQRNGTLMVNENVDRMNSGEFRTGYAFVPRDSNAILALANGIKNEDGVQYTSGHQLGNFGYGRNADNERWYYDDWDLIGDNTKIGFSLIGGKPFQVYDRDFKGGKKK